MLSVTGVSRAQSFFSHRVAKGGGVGGVTPGYNKRRILNRISNKGF